MVLVDCIVRTTLCPVVTILVPDTPSAGAAASASPAPRYRSHKIQVTHYNIDDPNSLSVSRQ